VRRWLSATVLAAALAGCAAPVNGVAPREPRVIAVAGRGEVSVKPDAAIARLGAEARRPTLAEATADVAQRMTAVLERVRALGVRAEDIATIRYAIEPQIARRPPGPDSADDPGRIVGYRVSNVVQMKVRDVAAIGRVVDGAVGAGANVIQGVQFVLEERQAAEAVARERAVTAARETAAQLAKAGGVTLGPLVSLTEGAGVRPVGAPREMMAMSVAGAGPIEAGELAVVVSVEARYRVE
jgi:hypothetical protein